MAEVDEVNTMPVACLQTITLRYGKTVALDAVDDLSARDGGGHPGAVIRPETRDRDPLEGELDVDPVEKPEEVYWVDPIHKHPHG